jgi:hypothetical protein
MRTGTDVQRGAGGRLSSARIGEHIDCALMLLGALATVARRCRGLPRRARGWSCLLGALRAYAYLGQATLGLEPSLS